jgi:hypothetical protein
VTSVGDGEAVQRYSVDSSALIDLKDYYPEALFPGIWRIVDALASEGRLWVCSEARDECHDDPLRAFLRRHASIVVGLATYEPVFAAIVQQQARLRVDVVQPSLLRTVADPFVVALALHLDGRGPDSIDHPGSTDMVCAVLSSEKSRAASSDGRVRQIPDICAALQLGHVSLLQFLQREGYTG